MKLCHLPHGTAHSESGQERKGLLRTLETPPPPGLHAAELSNFQAEGMAAHHSKRHLAD